MFERHRTNLSKASMLLHALKADPDRLDLLLELQRFLVARIRSVERAIQTTRGSIGAYRASLRRDQLPKDRAKAVKGKIAAGEGRVRDLHHLTFVWRCFGDGIAAIYQSTFALKHLYYDSDYAVKEPAGFLSGKAGFRREWQILKAGIKAGVPVVLSDATNIVRVGDVCALAGEDPVPIEVKSSGNTSARRARQVAHLQALSEFYANDGAVEFRGVPNVHRVVVSTPPGAHAALINTCIDQATRDGFATVEPEPGVRYVVGNARESVVEGLKPFCTPTTLVRMLSAEEDWLPCYPFTLSFTPANTLSFVMGHVMVFVLTELTQVKALFSQHGVNAQIVMDGTSALELTLQGAEGDSPCFRLSEQLFGRVSLEFQSLSGFAAAHSRVFDEAKQVFANAPLVNIPAGWGSHDDGIAVDPKGPSPQC